MHTSTAKSYARPHSHHHAGRSAAAAAPAASVVKPKLYNPRHPERTLLYQTIAEHFETWHELASAGQFDGQGDHHTPKPYVRQAFRKYIECGIFAHGYVTSPPGSTAARLKAWGSGFANFSIAGDWIYTGLNVGNVEGAVMGGRLVSFAVSGYPALKDIVGFPVSQGPV